MSQRLALGAGGFRLRTPRCSASFSFALIVLEQLPVTCY